MKKYFLRYSYLVALMALVITGCKKQLDVEPRQSIDAATALSSREAVEAAIVNLYARLKSARWYGRDMITHPEALADNGFATNKSGRLLPEATNVQPNVANNGVNHLTYTIWTNGYPGINQMNILLETIPTLNLSPGITQAERDRWEGQVYFMRGLYYFDFVKTYAYIPGAVVAAQYRGGVPLVLRSISSVDSALNFRPTRAEIDDIYTQIVADLTLANSKLLNAAASSSGVNFANKAAAQGLLARVNLYRKNYTEAKRWADSCISNVGAARTASGNAYVTQWRGATHQETLFQVNFASNGENIGVNESLQTSFTTLVSPGNPAVLGGFGDLVPTLTLLTDLGITLQGGMTVPNYGLGHVIASRSTDVRNLLYEPGNNGRGAVKVETTKFIGKNGFINLDNVPVIRIAEVYLTRAEAQATAGSPVFNMANALADLQFIKSRRYTDYVGSAQEATDNASTQTQLYEEILRQRRIELAFEGHRFFDLKRLGRDLVKSPHYNTVAFTDTRILPPIPQGDVDGNPNLKQNVGY